MTGSRVLDCCNAADRDWLIAYNALLNLHAKSGEASAAEAVYQDMLHNGPRPDSISVNTLIAAHAHVRFLIMNVATCSFLQCEFETNLKQLY